MFRTENDLWRTLLPIIRAGLTEYPNLAVKRAYQPTTQGDGDAPRVVLHRISSRRCGAQGKTQEWREDEAGEAGKGRMIKVETWRKEDSFSAGALVDRAPEDEGYTAKDVLESLGAWLQSDEALAAFRKTGMGILRVNDVEEIPYEDDRDSYRISVSLKFTLTYTQSRESEIPVLSATEFRMQRV